MQRSTRTRRGLLARSRIAASDAGDRVALYLPNIPAFALAYLGIQRMGGVAVSINAMLTSEEVEYILNDSSARIVFTVGDTLSNVPKDRCPALERIVVCEGDAGSETALGNWIAGDDVPQIMADRGPDEQAALLYTSGTTGAPKGATLTVGNVVTNVRTTVEVMGYTAADKVGDLPAALPRIRAEHDDECRVRIQRDHPPLPPLRTEDSAADHRAGAHHDAVRGRIGLRHPPRAAPRRT